MCKYASIAALALALAGCGQDTRDFRDLTVKDTEASRVGTSLRFLSACPSRHPKAAHIAKPGQDSRTKSLSPAIAGLAADFAVNFIGATLEQLKKAQNGTFLATGVYEGPEKLQRNGAAIVENGGCVVIYRGAIGPTVQNSNAGKLSQASLDALGLADTPAFYVEFSVEDAAGYRVLSLNHLIYADTSARARRSGVKSVVIALTMGLKTVPKDSSDIGSENVAVFRFHLGQLTIGNFYGADNGVRSASATIIPNGTNMIAVVHETANPSLAIEALASAFSKNKDDIGDAIKDELD